MVNLCPNCFAKRQNTDCCPFCHYRYNDLPDDNASLRQMTVLNHRYIIGRVLGVGGFGVTYLALNNETGEKCAVKEFMPSELAVRDGMGNVYPSSEDNAELFEHCKSGFLNEAKTLYTFRGDPTIVNVNDYLKKIIRHILPWNILMDVICALKCKRAAAASRWKWRQLCWSPWEVL